MHSWCSLSDHILEGDPILAPENETEPAWEKPIRQTIPSAWTLLTKPMWTLGNEECSLQNFIFISIIGDNTIVHRFIIDRHILDEQFVLHTPIQFHIAIKSLWNGTNWTAINMANHTLCNSTCSYFNICILLASYSLVCCHKIVIAINGLCPR